MSDYKEIVLTGGPGAGKSTAISDLVQFLGERGYRVLAAPETATLLWAGGLHDRSNLSETTQYHIQKAIVSLNMSFQSSLRAIASSFSDPDPVVIIYDRGPMDPLAYMQRSNFLRIFEDRGDNLQKIKEEYDLVVHMHSVATLKDSVYKRDANNPHRMEATAAEAAEADELILRAWVGHPHLRIVQAKPSAEEKLRAVRSLVLQDLEGSETPEIERKFLLSRPPSAFRLQEAGAARVEILQTYLLSPPETEKRVRRRTTRYGTSYHLTEKRESTSLMRLEKERLISEEEYTEALPSADPDRKPLRKTRYHFVYDGKHYELDHFSDKDIWLLEIELEKEDEPFSLPNWLEIEKEVTDDMNFRSRALAS